MRENEWCKLHNIKSGTDYLLYWIAFLLRDPFQPLPYLFLYGNQNSGKSILHQAIASADDQRRRLGRPGAYQQQ